MRDGDRVNGIELDEDALELSDVELQGRIDAGRFLVTFPREGAKFV